MKHSPTLIILAGGKSSRMKQPKGLLNYNGDYWINHQIQSFVGDDIIIGLGYDKEHYFEAIPWLKEAINKSVFYKNKSIRVIINPRPDLGLFGNLQSVLKQLNSESKAVILPVDVPLINTISQQKILLEKGEIVIPTFENKKGHPIALLPTFWKKLQTITPTDSDARLDFQIKKRKASAISLLEINDASCILNLNTPKEWQLFLT